MDILFSNLHIIAILGFLILAVLTVSFQKSTKQVDKIHQKHMNFDFYEDLLKEDALKSKN